MKLEFYHTDDSPNTINKALTKTGEYEITLKASTNLLRPDMVFSAKDFPANTNYMLMLDKYYFVELEYIRNNLLVIIHSTIDVLETYKDIILNSQADIIQKSTISNTRQNDVTQETVTKVFKSDTTIPVGTSIIMQTAGQPKEA